MPRFLRRHATLLASITVATLVSGGSALPGALTRVSPYLTRAEAAAIMLLASPAPLPAIPTTHPYVDVLPTDWFAPSVLAAAKLGVLSPDSTGTHLKPLGSVNRAAFLKMLNLTFGLPAFQRHSFADVPANSWYAPYAGTEETYRLFTHANPAKLEPERLVTQDEARTALQVFMQLRSKAEDEEAKKTAVAQASGQVQLYSVISTKKLRVLLVTDSKKQLTSVAESVPAPERTEYIRPASSSSFSSSSSAKAIAMRPAAAPAPIVRQKTTDEVRAEILALVNQARANVGLPALTRNAALEKSAQAYADQMNGQGFFGHTDPNGKTLKDRIDIVGYYSSNVSSDCQCIKGYALGENLARGQRSADEVVRAWMDSPSHREAILGSDFTDLGVGIQSGIWVQHFGGVLLPGAK